MQRRKRAARGEKPIPRYLQLIDTSPCQGVAQQAQDAIEPPVDVKPCGHPQRRSDRLQTKLVFETEGQEQLVSLIEGTDRVRETGGSLGNPQLIFG